MDDLTPRSVECRSCGAPHVIYPDFDRDDDADLCGACWLIAHSAHTNAAAFALCLEVQR